MKRFLTVVVAAALLGLGTSARAATITFDTVACQTTSGGAVEAQATFTTGANSLTIVASNLLTAAEEFNVAQNLSGIFFTLSGSPVGASLFSSSGAGENIADNGTSSSAGTLNPTGWAYTTPSEICTVGCGSVTPAQTIIGGTLGDVYSNANSSIAKSSGPHNPFLYGPVTFVIHFTSGVTADTTVSNVIFQFGSEAGKDETPTCVDGTRGCTPTAPVPEPGSLTLLGAGLVSLAGLVRRRLAR